MPTLFLVRHGETTYNRASRYSGQAETALTGRGLEQHARLRERLAGEDIGRVASSDLGRCLTLAGVVASDHGLVAEPYAGLREAAFGDWEGLTYEEALTRNPAAMAAFNRDPLSVAPPGGESLAALGRRARPLLDRLVREHEGRVGALLVVSHGGLLRALLCHLLRVPADRYWTLRVDPAALTVLDTYPAGAILAVLNDTCHLRGLSRC